MSRCWCGEPLAEPLGEAYRVCQGCGTAALVRPLPERHFTVEDDERDFYGRRYWFEYQAERRFPSIVERAQTDLSGRCLFWLERVLARVRPPGRVLEIGCGHGGFVALLGEAGFSAEGTELSGWVVDFARTTFGVRVHRGPLDALALAPGFHAVCAFDVLEHVADPLALLRQCRQWLDPRGVLFLQTPWYRGEGPDWSMLQEDEHVFLFSETGMRRLLARAGFGEVLVAPSLYPYDMWVVTSPGVVPAAGDASSGNGWRGPAWLAAVTGLRADIRRLDDTLAQSEVDRAARLAQTEELTRLLHESEADRAARLVQVEELTRLLHESEADRAARLAQVEELTRLLRESEADRAARLTQIEQLTQLVHGAEAARAAQVETLTRQVAAVQALAEGVRVELAQVNRRLQESEAEGAVRAAAIGALEAERVASLEEIQRLRSELDRITRTWVWRARERLRRAVALAFPRA